MEESIKVKDIVQRIVALSYMANEKVYSEDDRKSFLDEAKYLIQMLKDFGYDEVI